MYNDLSLPWQLSEHQSTLEENKMPLAITYDRLRKTVRQPNNSNKGNIIREVRGALKPYQKEWDSHYGNDYGTLLEEDKNIEDSDLSDQDYDALLIDLEKSVALLMNKEPVAIVDIIPENLSYNIAATYFGEDKSQWRRKYDDINMTDWTPPQRPGLEVKEEEMVKTDWQPPATYGLNNSTPIVTHPRRPPQLANDDYKNYSHTSSSDTGESGLFDAAMKNSLQGLLGMGLHDGLDYSVNKSSSFLSQVNVEHQNPVNSGINNQEDDDDEEDDDEEEEEEEEEEGRDLLHTAMSPDLMRLLGLQPSDLAMSTDWKPPSRPGLDNSSPIIKQALGLPPLNQETDWRPPQESGLHNSAPIVRFHT
eukprot:gene303-325_t